MNRVSQSLDRTHATFDDDNLVVNAGLLLPAILVNQLDLETLINATVRLDGRVGGASPGRKVLMLMNTMLAGGSHIDHADMLRAGATGSVVSHQVIAPSTLGTFLRSFSFGHVRQLEAVNDLARQRAWAAGLTPGALVVDVDSTICEVVGKAKQGANYGYTHVLGYHPLLATIARTGEILHGRLRKGSANTRARHDTLRQRVGCPRPPRRPGPGVDGPVRCRVLEQRHNAQPQQSSTSVTRWRSEPVSARSTPRLRASPITPGSRSNTPKTARPKSPNATTPPAKAPNE